MPRPAGTHAPVGADVAPDAERDVSSARDAEGPTPPAPAGALLGADGPLAREIPGFAPRAGQQEMAAEVAALFERDDAPRHLILEAGTGTGKTFAYLAPILAAGRRAIVSTATKPLQAQLVGDDLPRVARALGVNPKIALLKGRANYLCRHRLNGALADPRLPRRAHADLARVETWRTHTRDGDIAGLDAVPESSPVWPFVTSTVDNCLGGQCPEFENCFAVAARLKAMDAEIVVVNHHLLVSDLALKSEGFGELLPEVDVVVVDEAHALIEVVRRTLGFQVSARQLTDLGHDARRALAEEASGTFVIDDDLAELGGALERLDRKFGALSGGAASFDRLRESADLDPELETMGAALSEISATLSAATDRGPMCANAARRFSDLTVRHETWVTAASDAYIRWVERTRSGFVLRATPHDIADAFRERRARIEAPWVFTSATMAVGERFSHFTETLGIDDARTARWESPFDFAHLTRLYLPKAPCEPGHPDFAAFVAEVAFDVVRLTGGRAFVLFTSHQALRRVADLMRPHLTFPMFVQGDAPRESLLEAFVASGQGVLFGTSSFWEGVDVRGQALSAIVIDKLPFPRPDDPIRRARADVLAAEGRDAFREDQLPSAVLALKQGVGRLVRDVSDAGIVAICDPRLVSRGYGRMFLRSLPPMPVTRDFDEVRAFWEALDR